jgi:hypothetical protein
MTVALLMLVLIVAFGARLAVPMLTADWARAR